MCEYAGEVLTAAEADRSAWGAIDIPSHENHTTNVDESNKSLDRVCASACTFFRHSPFTPSGTYQYESCSGLILIRVHLLSQNYLKTIDTISILVLNDHALRVRTRTALPTTTSSYCTGRRRRRRASRRCPASAPCASTPAWWQGPHADELMSDDRLHSFQLALTFQGQTVGTAGSECPINNVGHGVTALRLGLRRALHQPRDSR